MNEIFLEKSALRKEIKDKIKVFCENKNDKNQQEKEICQKIINSQEYKKASLILAYSALSDEVDLSELLGNAFAQGKIVALPVVNGDEMNFFLTSSTSLLEKGAFGIMEPSKTSENLIGSESILENTLVLVPGRAFTKAGKRLGRGKGYYDKWFSTMEDKANQLVKWGICFPCQLVDDLPSDENDIPMDQVVF